MKTNTIRMRAAKLVLAGFFICAGVGAAHAQMSPAEVLKSRQSSYKDLGAAFKNINDQLKRDTPAKLILNLSSQTIVSASKEQFGWFPAGSGPETGVKTRAKPVIWTDQAGFRQAQQRFQTEAAAMSAAIAKGDVPGMRVQAKSLGQACSGCHDKYRVKDED